MHSGPALAPLLQLVVLGVEIAQGVRQGCLEAGVIHVLRVQVIPLPAVAAEDGQIIAVGQVNPVALVQAQVRTPVRVVLDFDAHFHVLKNMKKANLQRIQEISMTPRQRKLAKKHGTPAEFAAAVYKCVPGDISMDEARAAIEKYNVEWEAATGR